MDEPKSPVDERQLAKRALQNWLRKDIRKEEGCLPGCLESCLEGVLGLIVLGVGITVLAAKLIAALIR